MSKGQSRAASMIWGQFHQQFISSFYALRSQKRRKDSQVKQLFALSGSVCLKAARKFVGEIDDLVFKLHSEDILVGLFVFKSETIF